MWRQGFCTVYDHANMPHKSLWEVSPYYASKTACGARGKPCQIIWRTPAFYLSNHSSISKEQWEEIHELFSEPRYLWLIQPVPGVQAYLTQLAKKFTIHLVTSLLSNAPQTT